MTEQKIDAVVSRLRPRITILAGDYERLSVLARAAMNKLPEMAEELADELARADVVAVDQHPEHIVCMGCDVTFRDDTTGKAQKVTLVYPEQADISQRKVSVLTPVGTALIGLRVGHSITWETTSGEVRRLTVLEVHNERD